VVSAPDEHDVEVGHSVPREVSEEGRSVESSSRPALFKEDRPGKPQILLGCYVTVLTLLRVCDRHR
jgi:hypothetical protein